MEFERLFAISAFEALRLIRGYLEEFPSTSLAECAKGVVARSPQAAALDIEAALYIHTFVHPNAPYENVLFYRHCVMSVMLHEMPTWAKLMTLGRGRFIKRLKSEEYRDIRSVFREARLLDEPPVSADIVWWDSMLGRVRLNTDEERLIRARKAEELSLNHEKAELKKLGIATPPIWMAIEDNTVGYDVLSYRPSEDGQKNLLIEVKSTIASPLRFIISRNEWENADEVGDSYVFHVWDMAKAQPALFIRTVEQIRPHIPQDNSQGKWKNAEIPILSISGDGKK